MEPWVALEALEPRLLLSVTLNAAGWTEVGASVDTQVIYVSNSQGDDANSGLSSSEAVQTIAKGKSLIRDGFPDWLLLRRGDVWNETIGFWSDSGRSEQEPVLISSYGTAMARPLLKAGTAQGFHTRFEDELNNIAIIGIHFYANTRDPDGPDFVDTSGGSAGIRWLSYGENLLIEDVVVDSFRDNIIIQATSADNMESFTNFKLRRSLIIDAYTTGTRAQGLYVEKVDGILLEENIFDHNGWNETLGTTKTVFSHNVYIHSDTSGLIARGNIFARGASHGLQARAGGIVDDNVFLDNAIALSFGAVRGAAVDSGRVDFDNGVEGSIVGNVFIGGTDISQVHPRGIGIELGNTNGAIVANNIFAHGRDVGKGERSISYEGGIGVGVNNTDLINNTFYNWRGDLGFNQESFDNNTLSGNYFYETLSGVDLARFDAALQPDNFSFTDNTYFHSEGAAADLFQIELKGRNFSEWQSLTGETGTFEELVLVDPTRTTATYNLSLGGVESLSAYLDGVRLQSKSNYDPAYTVDTLLDYIREGYAQVVPDITPPTATLQAGDITEPDVANHLFTVTYVDDQAVDLTSLGNDDVQVTGPNGYLAAATLVNVQASNADQTVVVTYQINAPDPGGWLAADNGTYNVILQNDSVVDTSANAAAGGTLGTFIINVEAPLAPEVILPASQFSDDPVYGNADSYTWRTSGPWQVVEDQGSRRYAVSADKSNAVGGLPSEYAIMPSASFGDFSLSLVARVDSGETDDSGEYVIGFDVRNGANYSYVKMSTDRQSTQLWVVQNGKHALISTATTAGVPDDGYQQVQLLRVGTQVVVRLNGITILHADDTRLLRNGALGFGTWNDTVYFDDITAKAL